jgi:DNA-binding PadR family transcriptional regulator
MTTELQEKTTTIWLKEAQKGFIRIGVLILLNKKPSHGYEIMKEINNRSKGFWKPTAGGVYPILRDLEKSGYIKGEWQTQKNRKLKVYKITESGELILRRAILKQAEISDNIGNLFREFARDVLNVEAANVSLMHVPSLFAPFLEEKPRGKETLKHLEHDRKHICEAIETMQDRLRIIDGIINSIKKEPKKELAQNSK